MQILIIFVINLLPFYYRLMEVKYRESIDLKTDLIDLGILINRLREFKGLTLRDLSVMSGVSVGKICELENGKLSPSFYTLSKLCRSLGYSVANAYTLIEASHRDLDDVG